MHRQVDRSSEKGNVLIMVLAGSTLLSGLLYATVAVTATDLGASLRDIDKSRTMALAQAGVELTIDQLRDAARKFSVVNPMTGIQALFAGGTFTPYIAEPLIVDGQSLGEFTVSVTSAMRGTTGMDFTIDSTGYYPQAPVNTPSGSKQPARQSLRVSVFVDLERSKVFDSAYFINNWGWFYGNTIHCYGNARSNGQFDVAHYQPLVGGQPTYDSLTDLGTGMDLAGYRDDNRDGLEDGNDGGIFSAWDIVAAENVRDNGGQAKNQHDFEDAVEMPNLTDLSRYETEAVAKGSSIRIGGTTVVSGVYGDDVGERQNLYLIGTAAQPIEIDGPVVVRGDVIIAGVIKGQGAIYSGGNVYVPNDLEYDSPPTTPRPADNTEASTEAWLTANKNKDFLSLLARENVVLGNHLNSTWRSYVGSWLSHSMNGSREDAGEDKIPNTAPGKDGISGTADDDVLEGDGTWTVETYSAADDALGLIPPGYGVGDPIPGSGEDIDGDGQYDDTLSLTDLDFSTTLNSTYWGGNIPSGTVNYNTIASTSMTRVDGAFYTNHAFAFLTLPSTTINMNGCIVSRNESIIYGGPGVNMNYDVRLLGGNSSVLGDLLPRTLSPFSTTSWMILDWDPNRNLSK